MEMEVDSGFEENAVGNYYSLLFVNGFLWQVH